MLSRNDEEVLSILNYHIDLSERICDLMFPYPGAGFVVEGGSYLGLCAGAYYASSYVEFDLGTRCG